MGRPLERVERGETVKEAAADILLYRFGILAESWTSQYRKVLTSEVPAIYKAVLRSKTSNFFTYVTEI
jgi:hypothetical protein